jgi:hypothetical protein
VGAALSEITASKARREAEQATARRLRGVRAERAPAKGDAAWKSEWSGYKVRLRA